MTPRTRIVSIAALASMLVVVVMKVRHDQLNVQPMEQTEKVKGPAPFGGPNTADIASDEKSAIGHITYLMREQSEHPSSEELLKSLKQLGLDAFTVQNEHPGMGSMLIIRTKNTLSGTRYFHAQYFTNSGTPQFLQHMSFEFKPGPESMKTVTEAVSRTFSLAEPIDHGDGYVSWQTRHGYLIWVKKLKKEDLMGDPFNAYAPEDLGTIRIAIEQTPPDDDDQDPD